MGSHFNAEHEAFRKSVRTWVERELLPHALEWDRAGIFPREVFKQAGELGQFHAQSGGAEVAAEVGQALLVVAEGGFDHQRGHAHLAQALPQRRVGGRVASEHPAALLVQHPHAGALAGVVKGSDRHGNARRAGLASCVVQVQRDGGTQRRMRRIAFEPVPCMGRTQCQELNVLTNRTHWLGSKA